MAESLTIAAQMPTGPLRVEADENNERRVLAGVATVFGEVGFTSVGPTKWLPGAFDASARPPVDRDHDITRLIGVVSDASADDKALSVRARVSRTPLGDETLALAEDAAVTGFSVTVLATEWYFEEDDQYGVVLVVAKGEWVGLAVTPFPAFDAARIATVAASLQLQAQAFPHLKEPTMAEPTVLTLDPTVAASLVGIGQLAEQIEADRTARETEAARLFTEASAAVEAKRARLAKKVAAEVEAAGLTLSEVVESASGARTKKLEELTVDELDEARQDISAAQGPATIPLPVPAQAKRKVFASAGEMAASVLKAARGDQTAAARVKAAWDQYRIEAASQDGNLAEVTTADIPGLIPPTYTTEVLGGLNVATPVLTQLYRHTPLPPVGMEIIKPKWDVLPDGDWYTVENGRPATNTPEIGTQSVTVLRYAHAIRVSIDALERSGFGGFAQRYYEAVSIDYLSKKEAKATDVLVDAAQETATAGTPQAQIATLVAEIIANQQDGDGNFRGLLPDFVALAPDVYGTLMTTTTTNGLAFANGNLNFNAMSGDLAGLQIVMAPAMDAGGILVGSSAAAVAYDGAELQLRSVIVNTMSNELGVFAWTAFDVDYPAALACNFLASN